MRIQALTSFCGTSVNNTRNNKKPDIHRYRDPNTDAYFYYDTNTGKEVPCDTFTKTVKNNIDKKSKNSKLQDSILEYWEAIKW